MAVLARGGQEMQRTGKRITPHDERVMMVLSRSKKPITANELSKLAEVAPRTARNKLLRMVDAGKVERFETWPALTFRLRR